MTNILSISTQTTASVAPLHGEEHSVDATAPWDATMVGRRVLATFTDKDVDDAPQW